MLIMPAILIYWKGCVCLNIIEKKITEIIPYEKNARKNDEAVDKWLKSNSKKYGYKYTKQN